MSRGIDQQGLNKFERSRVYEYCNKPRIIPPTLAIFLDYARNSPNTDKPSFDSFVAQDDNLDNSTHRLFDSFVAQDDNLDNSTHRLFDSFVAQDDNQDDLGQQTIAVRMNKQSNTPIFDTIQLNL